MPTPSRLAPRLLALLLAGSALAPAVPLVMATPALASPAPDGFADLAEKLLPAVVNISSSQNMQASAQRPGGPGIGPEMPQFPPGSPFEQFFKDFLDRNRRGGNGPNQPPRRMQSLGSGFIIDPSGVVVTNNHVIEGADEITVKLQDGTELKATLIGKDERADIAVLKVSSDKPLPSVPFGDSDKARVGNWVVAIGNPFGLGGSVTAGIVSARGRDIGQGPYDDFLQTDAAINRGNSGGPLFNLEGEVIGINTAIYSPSGGSIGIGFSIPSNLAKNVVEQLREYGRARRGWLGVRIQAVSPDIAESLGLHEPSGAIVAGVEDNGPAAAAKLKQGDVILKFNGQDIKEMRNLPRVVAETPIGKSVPVTIWRDGKEQTVQATVGELPDDPQKVASADTGKSTGNASKPTEIPSLGLSLSTLTPDMRDKFKLSQDQKGVVVTDVTSGTTASDRGLKAGDVIVEVQQEEVSSPADVIDRIDRVRKSGRQSVLILVQNGDGMRWVPLSLKSETDRKPG